MLCISLPCISLVIIYFPMQNAPEPYMMYMRVSTVQPMSVMFISPILMMVATYTAASPDSCSMDHHLSACDGAQQALLAFSF